MNRLTKIDDQQIRTDSNFDIQYFYKLTLSKDNRQIF